MPRSHVPARRGLFFASLGLLATLGGPAGPAQADDAKAPARRPTLFLIGDSTVKNRTRGQQGWGDPLARHFDAAKVAVENRALGGRSSRTFLTEGLWDKVAAELRPGDFVLMQFGHNDGGSLSQGRARASLKGGGEETQEVVLEATGKKEVVHTYGWYLRKYIADTKAKGATPVVLSLVPRNIWRDGKVVRAANDYGKWAAEAARASGARFIDLNDLVAKRYEADGPEKVKSDYFGTDHTHTTPAGAELTAAVLAEAIRGLADVPLRDSLRPRAAFKFDFGPGPAAPGSTRVLPTDLYAAEVGYGFEPGATVVQRGPACTSDRPFAFSVAVPEGNSRVTVTLAGPEGGSAVTVKAELRRLMVERVAVPAGQVVSRTFVVNVRRPQIAGGGEVRLKPREQAEEAAAWDGKLSLEFNGERPALVALEVAPADVPTVYLLGDSTVCDQPREPYASWGQILPRFFGPGVAVANHAQSGESLRSAAGARRLDKVLSAMRPGDWLLIQFGHNDMKAMDAAAYAAELRRFVAAARAKGGQPVLVTPMHRRTFQGTTVTNSLRDFPDAVRQVAAETGVPLVDLHALSQQLYEALGPERSGRLFKPGDGTHHNGYGAYQLAKCVVEGLRRAHVDLVKHMADDVPPFDPRRPDPPEWFHVPASPERTDTKPDGN